ncbi:unnamed protein product [Trichogramma brassicae]|uniref:Chorion peroxidase n=1 Tax=Trichogramma brassicae TaxID=86971 RepID=A0A6H5HZS5_9HYME|nr:unnamed protein product [Trichogramma brassicae]
MLCTLSRTVAYTNPSENSVIVFANPAAAAASNRSTLSAHVSFLLVTLLLACAWRESKSLVQVLPPPIVHNNGAGEECALIIDGPGRSSLYDYAYHLLRRSADYGLTTEQLDNLLPLLDTSKTLIRDVCPAFLSNVQCKAGKYRRFDGLCTNLEHPSWGGSLQPFVRLMTPKFADGINAPRIAVSGRDLPLARVVSQTIHPDEGFHDHAGTVMVIAWGQFIDHDYTLTATPLGEIRVNEQLVLTCMHTLMAREHNHLARGLALVNPHWDDETLFQEARRIVIAQIQHITYNEFLPILLGRNVMQKFGLTLEKDVTNHLFKKVGAKHGMDLVSLNMQRGREFGIPGYMEFRKLCGLPWSDSFEDLFGSMPNETVRRYMSIFEHPADVDLWSGGVSERPLPESMLGPTFACIIATQFSNTRRGDRFWYELPNQPSSFTPAQLREIRKTKLARVICDNTDLIDTIQVYPMVLPDHEMHVFQKLFAVQKISRDILRCATLRRVLRKVQRKDDPGRRRSGLVGTFHY